MPINEEKVDVTHFKGQRNVGEGGFGLVKAIEKVSDTGGDKGRWYAMKM